MALPSDFITGEAVRAMFADLEKRLRSGRFPVVQHARQHQAGGIDRLPSAAAAGGHTIRENGTDQTARTGLNFIDADAGAGLITDDAGGNETEVNLNLYRLESQDHTHASTGLQGGILYGEVSITIENPSGGEDLIMRKFTQAVTITAITAIVIGGTSVKINPKHGTTVTGADLLLTAEEVVATASTQGEHINGTGTAMATTLSDVTLAAGEILRLITTAIVGTPTLLHVTVQYRLS